MLPPGLYARLLGPRWHELAEIVRRLHGAGEVVHAAGTFRVRHGGNRAARFLAWLARLPAASEAVDLRLIVTPVGAQEEWRRHFADQLLVSRQWRHADGLLAERIGLAELGLQVTVHDNALRYESKRVALPLGPLRIRLPGWLAPRVTACEKPEGNALHVSVEVRLPLLGILIAYEGTLIRIETKPC